jgi:hypothetical protein
MGSVCSCEENDIKPHPLKYLQIFLNFRLNCSPIDKNKCVNAVLRNLQVRKEKSLTEEEQLFLIEGLSDTSQEILIEVFSLAEQNLQALQDRAQQNYDAKKALKKFPSVPKGKSLP